MQGRKGIGRYATAILGNEVFLETNDEAYENTTVYIDWEEFEKQQFLDDVPILIEKYYSAALHAATAGATSSRPVLSHSGKAASDTAIGVTRSPHLM